MAAHTTTPRVAWIPFCIGLVLWIGATALLLEDAWRAGHFTVQHALMPILTASTVAAAVYAHRSLVNLYLLSGLMFGALAVLGSGLTVYGTMGRVAEQHDGRAAKASGSNDTYRRKETELKAAKAEQAKECRTLGPRCVAWNSRVDQLTAELDGRVVISADPRADAVVRIAKLFGADEGCTRQLISALDAPSLPLFLELGSIIFFAAAFPKRRQRKEASTLAVEATASDASVSKVFSLADARADFRQLKACNSQSFLAERWGVSESTVSRWLGQWQGEGFVHRAREGKRKTLALPAPERKRLGHIARV